jgi:hypothetical protein
MEKNYQYLVDTFGLHYLTKAFNNSHRKCIMRIRLSPHNLRILTDRYIHEIRKDRRCIICVIDDLEDECHFIFKYPLYEDLWHSIMHSSILRRIWLNCMAQHLVFVFVFCFWRRDSCTVFTIHFSDFQH